MEARVQLYRSDTHSCADTKDSRHQAQDVNNVAKPAVDFRAKDGEKAAPKGQGKAHVVMDNALDDGNDYGGGEMRMGKRKPSSDNK